MNALKPYNRDDLKVYSDHPGSRAGHLNTMVTELVPQAARKKRSLK